jgi:HAD superfamily hydrolase (TIGR01549 family)
MIQAAIFDIGNVLLKFNYLVAAERLRLVNGLDELPEREIVVQAKQDLEAGRIGRAEFLDIATGVFQHSGDQESFLEIWRDIFHPNLPMVEFARSLSGKMPVYLLSNISCIHREFIFAEYDFFSIFRDGAFSYELGCLKPEPEIYRRALAKFSLCPEAVVLFDDMLENVESARAGGWQALQYDFRHHGDFLAQAASLGLTSDPLVH